MPIRPTGGFGRKPKKTSKRTVSSLKETIKKTIKTAKAKVKLWKSQK